jgi:hypothetical protein
MATVVGLLVTLFGPVLVRADNVINDVDSNAPPTLTLGENESVTVNYWIQATGGDGQTGCNASDGSPATVDIIAPAGVTASPTSLTFTACKEGSTNNSQSVTFTGTVASDADGYAIAVSVDDDGAGTYNVNPAKFDLVVEEEPTPQDTTRPDISYTLNGEPAPPANPNGKTIAGNPTGWYTVAVDLVWTVTDLESAITSQTGCGNHTFNTDNNPNDPQSRTCEATSAGGTRSVTTDPIKIDRTAPEVSFDDSDNTVRNNREYYFGFVPAKPGCNASDATPGSGLNGYGDNQAPCKITGDANYAAVGSHTLTAEAQDKAGNTTSTELTYTVLAWTLNGFFRPVDMGPVLNTIKGGQTVPLKFEVFAGDRELTDLKLPDGSDVVKNFTIDRVNCTSLEVNDTDPVEPDFITTGGTSLRYDATDGQFVQNWKTPTEVNCFVVTMKTQDGSDIEAFFKTTKK